VDIVVCLKQVIDPEAPTRYFAVDPATHRQVCNGLSLVVSAYDLNALEVGLRLREAHGGRLTALSVGPAEAEAALRTALQMGADAAYLVSDPALDGSDAFGVAHALACAVRRIGTPDLVLTGCESGDLVEGLVGPALAEALGIGCLTYVARVERAGAAVRLRRSLGDGYEVLEADLPLVVTVASDETNLPRYPRLKDVLAAARRTVPVLAAADVALDPARVGVAAARLAVADVEVPRRESACELVGGASDEAKGRALADRLRARNLV
jgi:electron transfer flavoprotein beta subunit